MISICMFYCALEIDVFGKLWSSFFKKVVNFACGVSNVGIFSGFECIDLSWFGKLSRAGLVEAKYFALEWLGTPGAVTMSSLSRELVFLILQFLDEEKFKETVHKLEQESGFYFNMKYFEDQVQAGEWDEVERYLSGFTKVEDNRYSMKIFFEIRKQKYLEALDKQDRVKAVDILIKDLKVFSSFNEDLFKEITQLLTLDNFRQNEQLSKYGDTKSARNIMLVELKKLIEANPLFRDKLTFPSFKASRLRTLINQSLNWQHQLCKNPRPNPDIKTLFTDHTCASTNGARPPPPSNTPLAGPVPKPGAFPPLGVHSPFQPVVSPSPSAIAGWMTSASPAIPHAAVAPGPPGIVQPPGAAAFLKHPRTPPGVPGMDYQTADSEHLIKRIRAGQSDEVSFSGSTHPPNIYPPDDLPKTVVRNLSQGSNVMSMDFHPQQQMILLVGTNVGDISVWEVGSRERLAHKTFKVWDVSACSMPLQTALVKDATVSVNRCVWGPDGAILGVAFSKHIIQIYTYNPAGELRQHLEIDAHIGGVNDIAFAYPNKQLCIVTCGDDRLEQESGFYFNMKYFEDQVQAGEWDEVERYLSGFTKVEDNRYSMKIFFEIRKQKYLEALDKQDRVKAVDILIKDLKVFSSFNEDLFKEITQLLTLDNFRQNEQLSKYGDTKSARNIMLVELKKLIEANPLFRDKLTFAHHLKLLDCGL
nr:protein TPR2-like isoform X1 [Ipomoea batatas]